MQHIISVKVEDNSIDCPIKVGDELIAVMSFDSAGPAKRNIERIIMRGNLDDQLTILSDHKMTISQTTFKPELIGTSWLLAKSLKAQEIFMAQWALLATKFDWNPLVDHLPMLKTNHISGYMVTHDGDIMDYSLRNNHSNFTDDWEWILQNATGKAWWHQNFWLFELEEDAALFKLSASN